MPRVTTTARHVTRKTCFSLCQTSCLATWEFRPYEVKVSCVYSGAPRGGLTCTPKPRPRNALRVPGVSAVCRALVSASRVPRSASQWRALPAVRHQNNRQRRHRLLPRRFFSRACHHSGQTYRPLRRWHHCRRLPGQSREEKTNLR